MVPAAVPHIYRWPGLLPTPSQLKYALSKAPAWMSKGSVPLPSVPSPRKAATREPSGVAVSALTTRALVLAVWVNPGGLATLAAANPNTVPVEPSMRGGSTTPPPLALPLPIAMLLCVVALVESPKILPAIGPNEPPTKIWSVPQSRTGPVIFTPLAATVTPEALHPFVVARVKLLPLNTPLNLKSRPLSLPT